MKNTATYITMFLILAVATMWGYIGYHLGHGEGYTEGWHERGEIERSWKVEKPPSD